jgi:transposase
MVESAPNPNCPGCQTLLKHVEALMARVSQLEAKIERLEARLRQDSSNSSRPPSSDPPWSKPTGGAPSSDRNRGGQSGHEKSERKLLPPGQVDETQCCTPPVCESCGEVLVGKDPAPLRHQVTDMPVARALVHEYQLHALKCRACGHLTRATLPDGVPRGAFGPGLQSMVALLSGVYRVSRRNVQQLMADAFGVELSLGMISKIEGQVAEVLAKPHQAALRAVRRAPIVHSDETSWREANKSAWLWTAVTQELSAFLIRPSRGSDVARELIGEDFSGTHVSDRWSGYNWIDIKQRQVCWSHLIRDFRKIADSGGSAKWIGQCLEWKANELFTYWHRVRDGTMKRSTFTRHAWRIRRKIRTLLETGARCDVWRAPSLCRGILELESAMWTFVTHAEVEPTNNTAERALRPAVIWRKTSLGTQSARGSRFVERLLTAVATLRQQGRNVLDYLTAANEAALRGKPIPNFVR